tara:strand:+ start:335 stop:766 length:432 start_codon:yes stop_codon:yes gene_type:complete
MENTNQPNERDRLAHLLTMGVIAGLIASAVNICYMFFYEGITGYSMNEYINVLSVSIATFIPAIFVALIYFSLRRVMKYQSALNVFLFIVIFFSLLSFIGPLSNHLPNGDEMPPEFTGLTIPMHILAPVIYITMIVRSVSVKE